MTSLTHAARARGAGPRCQDRAVTVAVGRAVVLAVADGAGGASRSERAASLVIERVERQALAASDVVDPMPWVALLRELDCDLARATAHGETTLVVCAVDADGHCGGVSVGDSRAWAIGSPQLLDLTARQKRKPLLGSGRATVVPFFHRLVSPWSVLVGTDGLFNYVGYARILECATASKEAEQLAADLLDSAALSSGALQDDIGIAVACLPPHS